jgi:hypothetical protein
LGHIREELSHWIRLVENILIARGVLDEEGRLVAGFEHHLPEELEEAFDGFIENPVELVGLLKIGRDARAGKPLSPAVLEAAHLMAQEILKALQAADGT